MKILALATAAIGIGCIGILACLKISNEAEAMAAEQKYYMPNSTYYYTDYQEYLQALAEREAYLESKTDEEISVTDAGEDEYLLAKIAMAEAEGEDTEGKALVICVVLNRIASDDFPDTIEEVIYQEGQFASVDNRWDVEPDDDCYEALAMVLEGWAESAARKDSSTLVQITGKPKANQALADELGAEYGHNKFGDSIIMNDDNDASRRMAEMCYRTSNVIINPIIDWTDDDVWGFLHHYGCESNPLYRCGWHRIGCIGCPLGGPASQKREFAQYPKYKAQYIRTFDKMLKAREEAGLETWYVWASGGAVMKWWLGENPMQMTWDEYLEALEGAKE